MELTYTTVRKIVEAINDRGQHDYWEVVGKYGEPGYWSVYTSGVILGNYWCRCDRGPEPLEGSSSILHSLDFHYPRVFAALEEQGWQLEWMDEWYIDHENDKCYRTTGDSYSWQPSIQWNEDICEYMTPDDDFSVWLEWAANDPARCLMAKYRHELAAAGFEQWEPGNEQRYESGWHEGQDDDPRKVTEQIRRELGDEEEAEVVFLLDETSQFYVGFSAWTRKVEEETA